MRLACIDASETAQRPYGQNARQDLQQRLPDGSAVRLDEKTTDRYGRLVAEVFNGITINLALVEDGQAFAYRQYLGDCNAREYLDAEVRASRRRYSCKEIGSYARAQDLQHWIETDRPHASQQPRHTARRLLELMKAVQRDPFTGIGKPEPLKYLGSGVWWRRITQEHRCVYLVKTDWIKFLQGRYHD